MEFSVIVPVYNACNTLRAAAESVLAQENQNWELLLVDDGSTDGISGALCDQLAAEDSRIQALHKQNGGAGDARNYAISLAQGDYLVFLDSDDALESCALSVLSEEIQKTHAEIYYFGRHLVTSDGTRDILPQDVPFDTVTTLQAAPELMFAPPAAWSAIWKRDLFLRSDIRFRDKGWGEDLAMTRKMLAIASSIVVLNKVLYFYIIRENSVTTSKALDRNHEIIDALSDVLDWYRLHDVFETYYDELCKLSIDNCFYDASLRILRENPRHRLLPAFREFMISNFPDYQKNPYLQSYSFKEKMVFLLLSHRKYALVSKLLKQE